MREIFWRNNLDDSANLPYRSRSIHFQYTCGPEYLNTALQISRYSLAFWIALVTKPSWKNVSYHLSVELIPSVIVWSWITILKHRSKSTSEWMKANKINHWPTPPESPDLNLIYKFIHHIMVAQQKKNIQ